ncbi:MAG: PEP-CTERM sorting domain-containing protein [Nitrospiraceae bacterium]|nr:MAG: PEP-CTERM sorting domain-containing protein [Nitrospiraceae bacterium]
MLVIGTITVVSDISLAGAPPANPFDITCNFYGGSDCTTGVTYYFAPGLYEFSIAGGWWTTVNPVTLGTDYSWSLYMDTDPSSSTNSLLVIGDGLYYGSVSAVNTARNNNYQSYTQTINFAGGDISFYTLDNTPRNNTGTISTAYSIVPEPVSSSLFIIGGAFFAGRRFIKKKNKR